MIVSSASTSSANSEIEASGQVDEASGPSTTPNTSIVEFVSKLETETNLSDELRWFQITPFRVPLKELFENDYFLKTLTTALTYNLYFPDNGIHISKLVLEAVTKRSDKKSYFLKATVAGPGLTIPECLGHYFVKTRQFDLLFELLNTFPEIELQFFQSKNGKLEFERLYNASVLNGDAQESVVVNYENYSPLPPSTTPTRFSFPLKYDTAIRYKYSEYSNQYVPNREIKDGGSFKVENFRSFLTCHRVGNLAEFKNKYDTFLTEVPKCLSINVSSKSSSSVKQITKWAIRNEGKSCCLNIRNFLISAFDFVRSLPSDGDLEGYIKIMMQWSVKGNTIEDYRGRYVEVDGVQITTDHEFILRLYLNPELHQFLKNYTIKMSSKSLLLILRSPDLLEVFEDLFSRFGVLIGFEYGEILEFLRPDAEFKLFEKFTRLDLCECLVTKYHKMGDAQYTKTDFRTLFFVHHRSLFLYCLHNHSFIETVVYYGRHRYDGVSRESAMQEVCRMIMKDSPKAFDKLMVSSNTFRLSRPELLRADELGNLFGFFMEIKEELKSGKSWRKQQEEQQLQPQQLQPQQLQRRPLSRYGRVRSSGGLF